MNRIAVAREMVKLAKRLVAKDKKADFGDLRFVMNLFDVFRIPPETSTMKIVKLMEMVYDPAVTAYYHDGLPAMKLAIKREYAVQKFIKDNGITLK